MELLDGRVVHFWLILDYCIALGFLSVLNFFLAGVVAAHNRIEIGTAFDVDW